MKTFWMIVAIDQKGSLMFEKGTIGSFLNYHEACAAAVKMQADTGREVAVTVSIKTTGGTEIPPVPHITQVDLTPKGS